MAPAIATDTASRASKGTAPPNTVRLSVGKAPFKIDKGLLAKRSAKVAALLEGNPQADLTAFFQHIKADPEIVELVARFCHGLEVHMTSDNIIPLICLSYHLQMTENHSPDNLLPKALHFLEHKIFPSWDEIIRSLQASSGLVFNTAVEIGLFGHLLSALSSHAISNPSLVAHNTFVDPEMKPINARRKLFSGDYSAAPVEDLTSLPLQIYEPIIEAVAQWRIPQENIAVSVCQYLQNHQSDKEVVEAVQRLLPSNSTTVDILLEMYTLAVSLDASSECTSGLEIRIGKQLDQAKVNDLLVLDLSVESLRQILKGYYGNYNDPSPTGLVAVAELMEEYLIEIAKEKEVKTHIFVEVAEMASSTSSVGYCRSPDAIYRAVDVYLDKHRELTELEKEEVCSILDFNKLSKKACEHAAQNQRLPLRVVVQALFVSQLQLREDISKAVGHSCDNSNVDEENEGDKDEIRVVEDEEEVGERIEIEGCYQKDCCGQKCKKKLSLWKEMKRKFGCMSSNTYNTLKDCECQINKRKKVHPKSKLR